jgi:hypothetical protein
MKHHNRKSQYSYGEKKKKKKKITQIQYNLAYRMTPLHGTQFSAKYEYRMCFEFATL